MTFNIKNIHPLYFRYDETKNSFLKKENTSDFYVSKELLKLTDILEKHKIQYEVDKDSNIIVLAGI